MKPIGRDMIVSLGTNCALTYNLRHFYDMRETGLLDWTITPLSCLPELIASGFSLVGQRFGDELERVELDDSDSVMHVPTGVLLHHAFRRDRRGRVSAAWRSEVDAVAGKFRFLGERMGQRLRSARVPALFINGTGFHPAMTQDAVERTHAQVIYLEIIDAVRDFHPGSDPFYCLLNGHAPSIEYVTGRPDVRATVVGNRGDWHEGKRGHYAGCKTAWREALRSTTDASPHDAGSTFCGLSSRSRSSSRSARRWLRCGP